MPCRLAPVTTRRTRLLPPAPSTITSQVVAEFALISNTSALTFMVAGTFKEIVTGEVQSGGRCRGLLGAGMGDSWWRVGTFEKIVTAGLMACVCCTGSC